MPPHVSNTIGQHKIRWGQNSLGAIRALTHWAFNLQFFCKKYLSHYNSDLHTVKCKIALLNKYVKTNVKSTKLPSLTYIDNFNLFYNYNIQLNLSLAQLSPSLFSTLPLFLSVFYSSDYCVVLPKVLTNECKHIQHQY